MLKVAYHIGVAQALREEDIETRIKEAQELGLDLEKLGYGGILGRLGQYAGKALSWGAAHPLAGRMIAGAGIGGLGAALTGGDVMKGITLGGLGGAAYHGLGGAQGIGNWMLSGAPGSGRNRFVQGLARGVLT